MILGDDIVIVNSRVAHEYLKVMEELDVEVNQFKSLHSINGHAEFAKRFINKDEDLSGLSLKQFTSISKGWSNLLALISKYSMRHSDFMRFLGYGLSSGNFS
jgi:hypothetical protein